MTLADIRNDIAAKLHPLPTFTYVPEAPHPPCAIVAPSSPFITPGQGLCDVVVNYDVILLAPVGTNEGRTGALDGLVESALPALWDDYQIGEVKEYYDLTLNGAQFLATAISTQTLMEVS